MLHLPKLKAGLPTHLLGKRSNDVERISKKDNGFHSLLDYIYFDIEVQSIPTDQHLLTS